VAIPLTEDAHRAVVKILEATERELADGGVLSTLKDWGSKYVGAVVRIAGLLHLARHGAEGVRRPIDQMVIVSALQIGTYFKLHAVQTFAAMQTDETTANMIYVLDRIIRTEAGELSERDIHRETRSRFNTVTELRPVLANLIDHGLIAQLPEPEAKGPGRPRSPRFAVHPEAPKYGTDWTQTSEQGSGHSVQSVHTSNTERHTA
jgi:hypothetical protein